MLGSHISMSFFAGMAFSFRYIPLYIALRREKYRERIMKILFREILSQDIFDCFPVLPCRYRFWVLQRHGQQLCTRQYRQRLCEYKLHVPY